MSVWVGMALESGQGFVGNECGAGSSHELVHEKISSLTQRRLGCRTSGYLSGMVGASLGIVAEKRGGSGTGTASDDDFGQLLPRGVTRLASLQLLHPRQERLGLWPQLGL